MPARRRLNSHPDLPLKEKRSEGTFQFNSTSVPFCEGDTVASALYASGVTILSRSFKYHRPRGLYDSSKVLGEGFGYLYSSVHGMECVSVRIGNFSPDRDLPEHPHHLSHADCVRVFEAATCHPGISNEIVFGVSDSDWPLYDMEHGRRAIGYTDGD